jgi:DNA polymerase-3 subunit epsilon
MFCIIDIESSGGPFGKEAMIEIAAFRYDGEEIVDQLISLVHPHRSVQPYVSKMTGITDKMLLRAPRFHEIAKRLIEITEDSVIVGHNVDFDYRMLRQEFARLGYVFERKTLDTIKLSQELIPNLKSYGLDKMCDELGLSRTNKHRAESDARATLELFEILREKDRQKGISSFEQSISENDYLKDKISDLQRSIKHSRGLYYLYDRHGKLLYLGASDNIKASINRLFLSSTEKSQKLQQEVHSLKIEPVGNWLISRVKRESELNEAKPPFNSLAVSKDKYGIFVDKRETPPRLSIIPLEEAGKKQPWLKISNFKAGERALRMYQRLARGPKGEVVRSILADFPADALFKARGRNSSEQAVFVVRGASLCGYYYYKLNDQLAHADRVEKLMINVDPQEGYDQALRLGILTGEFTLVSI